MFWDFIYWALLGLSKPTEPFVEKGGEGDEPYWASLSRLSRGVKFFWGAIALEWLQMLMDCAGYDSAGEGSYVGNAFFKGLLAVDGARVA